MTKRPSVNRRNGLIVAGVLAVTGALGVAGAQLMEGGTASADQSTPPGVPAIVTAGPPVQIWSGPGMTSPYTAGTTVQPNSPYTVVCYTNGENISTTQGGSTGSTRWDLIADPANPTTGLGYLPDPWLTVTNLGGVPDCATTRWGHGEVGGATKADPSASASAIPIPIPPRTGTDTKKGGPGEACVFSRPSGAGGLGHIGWGWADTTNGGYVFGSTEDVPFQSQVPPPIKRFIPPGMGAPYVPKGSPNGAWQDSGTRQQMLTDFANFENNHYTRYKCQITFQSDVVAAQAAADAAKGAGYCLAFNNCLDSSITILTAYGATSLPAPNVNPLAPLKSRAIPNNWFDQLTVPWSAEQSLTSTAQTTTGQPATG